MSDARRDGMSSTRRIVELLLVFELSVFLLSSQAMVILRCFSTVENLWLTPEKVLATCLPWTN